MTEEKNFAVASPITKEECDAVAMLYERIFEGAHKNKFKKDELCWMWNSLRGFFDSRLPMCREKLCYHIKERQ